LGIFNKYFLSIAENISGKITGCNKQITTCVKYSLFYLSEVFNSPFTNIVFHNTSRGEIEKIIHSFPWKISCGCDEIIMKILKKLVQHLLVHLCDDLSTHH
jgi:hypothetical protein